LNFINKILVTLFYLLFILNCHGQVKYSGLNYTVNGVQLLQDANNLKNYYYLPNTPKIATNSNGNFEFLFIKYEGNESDDDGGLFHALFEFSLEEDQIKDLTKFLKSKNPDATLVGQVPLLHYKSESKPEDGSFTIVSSILNSQDGENALTENVVTSGYAPFMPGSKAAIAANLSPSGATLLWESLKGETSDVSVSVKGFYEAQVESYNAIVKAEMETVYKHFSQFDNKQSGFAKEEVRKIIDSLMQNQVFDIQIIDKSSALDIDNSKMQGILDIIVGKLTTVMFDAKAGWAQTPEKELAVQKSQAPKRRKRSWLSKTFGKTRNIKYTSDNQFVLKNREDIRQNKFYLNLSKSSVIKVPFFASGNIGGEFYESLVDDNYFRIVNLDDPDFSNKEVIFQLDKEIVQSYEDLVNFSSLKLRKKYQNHHSVNKELVFTADDVNQGIIQKSLSFPQLGYDGKDIHDYEYKVSWSFIGQSDMLQMQEDTVWLKSNAASITLRPPFKTFDYYVFVDKELIDENKIKSISLKFSYMQNNVSKYKTKVIKVNELDPSFEQRIFCDIDCIPDITITEYSKNGKQKFVLDNCEDDLITVPKIQN